MSQFDAPYTDYVEKPRESSGMATATLVLGVLGIIPLCGLLFGLLALLVGVIAIATLGDRRGKGLAVTGIVLGLLFTVVWGGATYWFGQLIVDYQHFVEEGPTQTLQKGFNGDIGGFKADFDGRGATVSDEEAQAFLDELNQRYGTFTEARFDDAGAPPTQTGQARMTMPYELVFSNESVSAEIELIFANQQAQSISEAFMKKLDSITVFDSERGDRTYPPSPTGRGSAAPPTDTAGDDTGTDDDSEPPADDENSEGDGEGEDAPPGS